MTANPMLVSAGAGVVAGDIAAEGAKKAAKQQEAAADKAIKTQEAAAKKTEQAYQPYTGLGQGAANSLGAFMGLPTAAMGGGGGGGSAGGLGTGLGALPANTQIAAGVRAPASGTDTATGTAVPRDEAAPEARAARTTASSYGTGTLGGPTMQGVKMRAPNGDVAFIPQDQVPAYAARGAQIIGFNGQPVGGVL